MAIVADSIIAIGSDNEMMRFKGSSTDLLDVNEKFITPGFIDTHVHLIDGGFNLLSVQLKDSTCYKPPLRERRFLTRR